jgi:hypothetical protein
MKVVNIPSTKMMKKFFASTREARYFTASSNSRYCAEAFNRQCARSESIDRAA